jgi:hypothetical protein
MKSPVRCYRYLVGCCPRAEESFAICLTIEYPTLPRPQRAVGIASECLTKRPSTTIKPASTRFRRSSVLKHLHDSEQQCFVSPTGGRGRSGPMRMRCSVQQLENGAVRIMCGQDPKTLCEVSGCDEDHMALRDTPSLRGERATSEYARFTELTPGTTWITALLIARQRREEKSSALKERRTEKKLNSLPPLRASVSSRSKIRSSSGPNQPRRAVSSPPDTHLAAVGPSGRRRYYRANAQRRWSQQSLYPDPGWTG